MNIGALDTQDVYVCSQVEKTCTKIRTKFPGATFDIGAHPTLPLRNEAYADLEITMYQE